MSRRVVTAILTLALVAATGCTSDGSASNPRVQVRPVLGGCSLTGSATVGAPPVDKAVGFSLVIDGAERVCPTGPGMAIDDAVSATVSTSSPTVPIGQVELTVADLAAFNAIAADCYAATAKCPTRKIAFTLDGAIVSVANVQVPKFTSTLQVVFDDLDVANETVAAMSGD
jgi:hypothetical protein